MHRIRFASLALAALLVVVGLSGSALAGVDGTPANVESAETTAGGSQQAGLHIPRCSQAVLHCIQPPAPPVTCVDSPGPTDLFEIDCTGTDLPVIGPHWVEVDR